DMPWNPAILDQRIARIHRLGQKHKVQIFILLAEDSYEQRVAQLVKGKRDLFDNVIDPDASEDTVGVTKKMLETLIDDLAGGQTEETAPVETVPVADQAVDIEQAEPLIVERPLAKSVEAEISEDGDAVRRTVAGIQAAFGARIERVLAKAGGLLVVVEQWRDDDEQAAQQLSADGLPVAVIDGRTWRSLQRLGSASPLAETLTVFETVEAEQPKENPLQLAAEQKLRSAQILLDQQCTAGVMDLLASALLLKVAALNNQLQAPAAATAAVWLYGDIVPAGILTPEQAALVLQVVSLSQSPEVPEPLVRQVSGDVGQLFTALR
ncbi:MAG: helicase, partial [Methylococcaceae bacterium]|nr:helicase [Methylococcaceae bacterium]